MDFSSANEQPQEMPTETSQKEGTGFVRGIGLLTATAINMTQMCGIGPFITIPIMVATFGGPSAILGWIVGAVLALTDGLVWAELGAAMPGAGGTYIYLREAFQYRTGRLMPFVFVWTAILSIPLIMSTGVIGLVQYLGYLWPNMSWWETHLVSLVIVGIVVFALYRRIESIGFLTNILFVIMLLSIIITIVAALTHFQPALAFAYPRNAFTLDGHFFAGLGAGLLVGIYDYLGYNTTAYMGSEIRQPGKVIPWSIIISVLGIMVLYLALNISVLGVTPWQTIARSSSIASLVIETAWGKGVSSVVTVLIIITAFASVFTGLLGGSRVPYNAAIDGLFLRPFGKLHPRYHFPTVALFVMGVITAIGSFFDLTLVINMLIAVTVLVQGVGQVAALLVLRSRQRELKRPYRMWLYPLPAVIALIGWIYVYCSSGWPAIWMSLGWVVAGVIAFLIWAYFENTWPFGPKEIREVYLETPENADEGEAEIAG